MKKNKKLIIICSVIVLVLFIIIFRGIGISSNIIVIGNESDIKEVKYEKINENLYYTDELIESKQENKQEIINDYKAISDYLNNRYPNKEFLIANLNRDTLAENKTMIYLLNQMVENAVIEDSYLYLEKTGDKVTEDSDDEYSMTEIFNEGSFDKPNIKVTPKEIKKTALSLAKENVDKMKSPFSATVKLKGTYYLSYKKNKGYYYHVSINSSFIDINTDGEVIDSNFFNGVYE